MFDPTAFDNMKVVIEGALYDLDHDGEINIVDRNDQINMAKMSRSFDVSITLDENELKPVVARIALRSNLKNLAAELLSDTLSESQTGCKLSLDFVIIGDLQLEDHQAIKAIMLNIWGEARKITQRVHSRPLTNNKKRVNTISVNFKRLVGEDQMDDLVEMLKFVIATLQQLAPFNLA